MTNFIFGTKRVLYFIFVNNRVIKFFDSPALSMVVPPIVGLYYGTLDIWGKEWSWIANNIAMHEFIFTLLACFTVLVLFMKGIAEAWKSIAARRYQLMLESMITLFNDLVKKKKDRFNDRARGLDIKQDFFAMVAHPKDQLEHALSGTKRFLIFAFGIVDQHIGITIIQGNPTQNRWWYAFQCDPQRRHHKASDLMNNASTAKYCYDSGDSLFIPDIRKGAKDGVFRHSKRSTRNGIGSIFCKPVRTTVGKVDYCYVFTIAVFGEYLCTPYDEGECRACEKILNEVADRVELELYLHSMKQFQESGGSAT